MRLLFLHASRVLLLGFLSCSGAREVFIGFPPGEAVGEILTISNRDGDILQLLGSPFERAIRIDLLPSDDALVLELSRYSRPLSELGLGTPAVLDGALCARRCALVEPDATLQRVILPDRLEETEWEVGVMSEPTKDALIPDRITRCDPCAPLEQRLLELPGVSGQEGVKAVVGNDHLAIAGHTGGGLFRVDARLVPERICQNWLPDDSPNIRASGLRDDDELWVIAEDKLSLIRLSEQDPEQPCVTATSTTPESGHNVDSMAVAPASSPFEIFVMGTDGIVQRYDGATWQTIADIESQHDTPSLAWIGPGEITASLGDEHFIHVEPSRVRDMVVPIPTGVIRAQLYSERFGSVFMLRDHGLVIWKDGEWTTLPRPEAWLNPQTMTLDGPAGLLCPLSGGFLQRYFDGRGFCPGEPGVSGRSVAHATSFLGDHVLLGDITANLERQNRIAVLFPREGECPSEVR